jgi:hypothetical protein
MTIVLRVRETKPDHVRAWLIERFETGESWLMFCAEMRRDRAEKMAETLSVKIEDDGFVEPREQRTGLFA